MVPEETHDCPFCRPQPDTVFHSSALVLGLWDAFPVTPGHALLVTRRHVATWWEATTDERAELIAALDVARREIEKTLAPAGYNMGINMGQAAGVGQPRVL